MRYVNYHNFFFHSFSPNIRMIGKNIIFDDKNISKKNFYKNKNLFNIYDIDVDKILLSKKEPYGKKSSFKYFLGYNVDAIRPLCLKLPQMIGYVKNFDSNKTMYFKVYDNRLLKKYTKVWERVSILMNIDLIVNLLLVIMINA